MEVSRSLLWLMLGAAAVTAIPRVLPLVLLSRLALPGKLLRFLAYIPITVMAALVGQELFGSGGEDGFSLLAKKEELLAAAVTLAAALLTRSLLATVLVGVISMWLIRSLF